MDDIALSSHDNEPRGLTESEFSLFALTQALDADNPQVVLALLAHGLLKAWVLRQRDFSTYQTVTAPTWMEIAAALRRLDGLRYDDAILEYVVAGIGAACSTLFLSAPSG